MGNIQANVTRQTLSDFNNFSNTSVNNDFSEALNNCVTTNVLNVAFGSFPNGQSCVLDAQGATINITQTADSNCTFDNRQTQNVLADFKTTIKNYLTQFINADLQNKQGWFATAFSFQINDASNTEEVVNNVTNTISDDVRDICRNNIAANNMGTVTVCGALQNSTINYAQDAFSTATVSCISDVVTKAFTSNAALNEMYQKTDAKFASEQSGVGSLFAWLRWIILAAVILAVVIIIGVVLYLIFGGHGGKKGPDEQAQKKQILESALERKRSFERHHANINEALNRSRY